MCLLENELKQLRSLSEAVRGVHIHSAMCTTRYYAALLLCLENQEAEQQRSSVTTYIFG